MSDWQENLINQTHREIDAERKAKGLKPMAWQVYSKSERETVEKIIMPNGKEDGPLSVLVSERGIKTSSDFADFMGALMADVVSGRIKPEVAKAACLAGDKLLQVAKMQIAHGFDKDGVKKVLRLTGDITATKEQT